MAYCINVYTKFLECPDESISYITADSLSDLKRNYEELLVFEITRDYKNELEKMKEMEDLIK